MPETLISDLEVLKQPLETAIAIHTEDFEDFHMQENMHIVISVKDFKAIVTHAETVRGSISAHFSFPTKPLQFSYQNSGVHCEFTLMTTGDFRGASSTSSNANFVSTRTSSLQPSVPTVQSPSRSASEMPPPARPVTTRPLGSQTQRPTANVQARRDEPIDLEQSSGGLFVSADDEDSTWDPPNFDNEEEEETLGWDASGQHPSASFHPTFRDSGSALPSQQQQVSHPAMDSQGLEPTQRLSQVKISAWSPLV